MLVRSESYLPATAATDSSPSACCLKAVVGTGWRRIIAASESLSRKIRTAIPTRNATAIRNRGRCFAALRPGTFRHRNPRLFAATLTGHFKCRKYGGDPSLPLHHRNRLYRFQTSVESLLREAQRSTGQAA